MAKRAFLWLFKGFKEVFELMQVYWLWSLVWRDSCNTLSWGVFTINKIVDQWILPFLNVVKIDEFLSCLMNFFLLLSMVSFELWDEFFNIFVLLWNFVFMLLLHVDYHLFMLFFFCLDEFFISLFCFSFSKLFHFGKFHIRLSLSCNIGIQLMNNLSLFINDLMGVLKHALKLLVSFFKIIL